MSFHTKRSPSQAHRFLHCPGTFALCDTVPEMHRNVSGFAAKLGTATHALVERCLGEGSNPADYIDRIIELVGDEEGPTILRKGARVPPPGRTFFIVDEDMVSNAEMATTYVRERCAELGVDEKALELETRTNPLPDRDDTSGTADITIPAFPTLLEVVDYKNGYLTVEHTDNPQLMAYLLGKALESKWAFEEYMITVIQPNAAHVDGRIRSFPATKKELLAFQKTYRAGINNCEEAESDFACLDNNDAKAIAAWNDTWLHAGDHCGFCDAQPICSKRREQAQEAAGIDFADEPTDFDVSNMDADRAAEIKRWAPQLESLIRAADAWVARTLEAGFKAPGFKLVRGKSTRQWVPMAPDKLAKAIVKAGFVEDAAALYTTPELKSGPQVEKLVPAKKRGAFNDKFLVKPEGKLVVATEDDPREAVDRSPADDFADDLDDGDEFDFG